MVNEFLPTRQTRMNATPKSLPRWRRSKAHLQHMHHSYSIFDAVLRSLRPSSWRPKNLSLFQACLSICRHLHKIGIFCQPICTSLQDLMSDLKSWFHTEARRFSKSFYGNPLQNMPRNNFEISLMCVHLRVKLSYLTVFLNILFHIFCKTYGEMKFYTQCILQITYFVLNYYFWIGSYALY